MAAYMKLVLEFSGSNRCWRTFVVLRRDACALSYERQDRFLSHVSTFITQCDTTLFHLMICQPTSEPASKNKRQRETSVADILCRLYSQRSLKSLLLSTYM